MSRGLSTLLLITQDTIARADLRGGAVVALADEPRPAVDDLSLLVEAALRLGRHRPGRVWVLTSECWTQILQLPIEAVARLKPEEVDRALAFESEPFSSIPALEAAVGHQVISADRDQRSYWLIELSATQLAQVEEVVQLAGGRLAGLSHPGGLDLALSSSGSPAWQRVELWPGAIVLTRTGTDGHRTIEVRNTDPRPGRWEEEAAAWRDQASSHAFEGLHGTMAVSRDELPPGAWLSLADEAGLSAFLTAWAESLQRGPLAMPALYPPRRPMSVATRRATAGLLALVVLFLCLGHYFLIHRQKTALEAEAEQLRGPAQQLATLKTETDKIKKNQADLRKAHQTLTADVAHCRQLLKQQRQRLAAMLGVLAQRCPDELIVQRIDGSEKGVTLYGTSLQPELVNGLAGNLAATLGPLGWMVQPPGKHSLNHLTDGGPWTFEIEMSEALPAPSATQSETPAKGAARRRTRSEE